MQNVDTDWFNQTMATKQLSQRGLAKLLGCNASSVNRLIHGRRPLRLDEAERLAVFLDTTVAQVLTHSGIKAASDSGVQATRVVGFIDHHGEAHIDWKSDEERITAFADLPPSTVAVQLRTAMTPNESLDGWTVYIEPPNGSCDHALNRLSIISLESKMTMIGFLRRGYSHGTYNISNFIGPNLQNMRVSWASPVLLLRP